MSEIRAVIADDEKNIRNHLKAKLGELWPELLICGEAGDGLTALQLIDSLKPDIAFLDIRMPGLSGLQVAREITTACRIVFITAHDQYAVEAFEREAVDYLLKPVMVDRLVKTIRRLKKQVGDPPLPASRVAAALDRITKEITGQTPKQLQWIRAQGRDGTRIVPVKAVCYFTKQDQYTAVVTHDEQFLISKPIKDLIKELDPDRFWQIHRATIVNVDCIEKVSRSVTGRGLVKLKALSETLTVSRSFLHLFKQM